MTVLLKYFDLYRIIYSFVYFKRVNVRILVLFISGASINVCSVKKLIHYWCYIVKVMELKCDSLFDFFTKFANHVCVYTCISLRLMVFIHTIVSSYGIVICWGLCFYFMSR